MNFICSIKIFAAYIAIVMLGLCTGAFLYMTYSLCTVLVAGQKFSAFFLQGIFEVLPTVLSLCPLFISFYLIRHKEIPWYSVLVCMILHLCLWIFFIPALKEKLETQEDSSNKQVTNIDLLKRISNLEKIVYGRNE